MAKVSEHFKIEELVPEYIFKRYGASAQTFLDPRMIQAAEWLRTEMGVPMICNDWNIGGHFQNRGFRLPDSTVGATLSQHKFGRALDLSSPKVSCQEMYDFVMANQVEALAHNLTTMEDIRDTKTWLHISCQWNPIQDKILIIRP